MELPKSILVAVGGLVGAGARWGVLESADDAAWALVTVNSLGAFVLGWLAHGALGARPDVRLLVGVGFCGSFTTFSTLVVDIARDLDAGATGDAVLLTLVSIAGGFGAGALGMAGQRRPS